MTDFSTIQIKYSEVTAVPTTLAVGELAYSQASEKLYIGYAGGSVVEIGGKHFIDALGGLQQTVQAIQDSIGSTGSIQQAIDALTGRVSALESSVGAIQGQISGFVTAQQLADVQDQVTAVSGRVDSVEQKNAEQDSSIAALQTAVGNLEVKDTQLEALIASEVTALNDAIVASAAQAAQDLQGQIGVVNNRIDSEVATLNGAISNEAAARASADSTLQGQIDSVSDGLAAEISARTGADTALDGRVSALESAVGGSGDVTFGKVTVTGDLIVQGTTTTVDSTTVLIKDPVITVGTGSTVADGLDRGISYEYVDAAGAPKVGFFGVDTVDNKFKFIPDATATGNKFSGATGALVADVEGNASTATSLAVARNIIFDNEVSGGFSFNGNSDVTVGLNVNATSDADAGALVRRDTSGGVKFVEVSATTLVGNGTSSLIKGYILNGGTF